MNVKIKVWTKGVRVWPSIAFKKTDFNKQKGRERISLARISLAKAENLKCEWPKAGIMKKAVWLGSGALGRHNVRQIILDKNGLHSG